MRFATILASGLFAAIASAQTSASPSASLSPAQAAELECLNKCAADDVNCKAHCEKTPSPNASQAANTNICVAKCNQGDGSAAATKAYEQCVNACITNNFYTTNFGTPEQTPAPDAGSGKGGDSGSSSGSGSGSSSSAGSGSGSGSGSGKGDGSSSSGATKTAGQAAGSKTSGATSSPTDNAAPYVAGSALLGLLGAVLAL